MKSITVTNKPMGDNKPIETRWVLIMKIVETPPKTGEEFIVAWFDDGEANSHHYRYSKEHQTFERMSSASTYLSFTEKSIDLLCKNALIIIEG